MLDVPTQRTYRVIVLILVVISVVALSLVAAALIVTRPPSAQQVAATLTAAALPRYTATPIPTAVPTLPGVSPGLLLCQRQAGQAMHARQMAGAVNLADDRLLSVRWVSREWPVTDLNGALGGVMSSLDVALEVWQNGCTLFDRVQIEVYDREHGQEVRRLTVMAQMNDALRWRTGEINDAELIARLEVRAAPEAN
jgi:hypothetical protein